MVRKKIAKLAIACILIVTFSAGCAFSRTAIRERPECVDFRGGEVWMDEKNFDTSICYRGKWLSWHDYQHRDDWTTKHYDIYYAITKDGDFYELILPKEHIKNGLYLECTHVLK